MSTPQIYGFTASTFVPQSDFRATANAEGRWSATQSFKVRRDAIDSFSIQQKLAPGISITALDPDASTFWAFLVTSGEPEVGSEAGGWTTITLNFTGFWSANYDGTENTQTPKTYNTLGVLEEVSIMEHHKVLALSSLERSLLAAILDGTAAWDVTTSKIGFINPETGQFTQWPDQNLISANGIAAAVRIATGRISYKRPTFTWTEFEEDDDPIANADLNDLGKIAAPGGTPPAPTGSRDWLLTTIDVTQTGVTDPIYSKQKVSLLSERGGWDTFFYGT